MIKTEKQYYDECHEFRKGFDGHISFMTYDEYFDKCIKNMERNKS